MRRFVDAIQKDFEARFDWAKDGVGNKNPDYNGFGDYTILPRLLAHEEAIRKFSSQFSL